MRKMISAAAAGAASLAVLGSASISQAALVYGLTDTNTIISFDTAAPSVILSGHALRANATTPLADDLIGIDFRPSNNQLYGVGRLGGVYTIDPTTGIATQVSQLSTTLNGSRFGIDFNPVPDLLRIVSDTDQNLRVNVASGATTVDGTLNPGSPSVIGAAYANNDTDAATGTTLYVIDSVTDALYIQNPPNAGTLSFQGPLGVNISSLSGFDIQTVGGVNTAYAALQDASNGVSSFYRIDLLTGVATPLGTVGGGDFIDGIAVTIPEPTTLGLLGGAAALLLRRRAR